ncbi:Maintenance of mitochondrial morphology protein 1 [Rhizoctonia solani]|uniref:Maintenance of mitochondrial morphology protein 1 n=1 Tax=Rhizoctonia solani TaxID=456999 RepID=A0A8H7LLL5_9AGAM|nr:Maintenance of mitochondrial morphology protein 1 [Rhizoctonia solani]
MEANMLAPPTASDGEHICAIAYFVHRYYVSRIRPTNRDHGLTPEVDPGWWATKRRVRHDVTLRQRHVAKRLNCTFIFYSGLVTMSSLLTLVFVYLLGGLTFIPLVICAGLYVVLYITPPIGDPDPAKRIKNELQASSSDSSVEEKPPAEVSSPDLPPPRLKPLQGWIVARRTFEESPSDATYMGMMRSFLDSRSKDRRPRDTYYAVLKGTVLYLYEDEAMAECSAALDAGAYTVEIWPHDGLLDGELFAKRNCIRFSTKSSSPGNSPNYMASVSKNMKLADENEATEDEMGETRDKTDSNLVDERSKKRRAAFDLSQPWHLFIKNNSDMEDWYFALVQASSPVPVGATDPSSPLGSVFSSSDMAHLVATLDAQPDAIPTRWLNALLGRLFFSVYRTAKVEAYILGRLASKLAKVKRPGFLTALSVREVSVGSRPPTIATPMLKELTRWGDAALELKFLFDGELRLTIAATAEVSLGARFRPYVVQLVLAVVVRKIEGNVLVKVKRPPSNRIWYGFTSMPKLEIDVLPVVSDREIKWGVVLKPIETQLKEIVSLVINLSSVLKLYAPLHFYSHQLYSRTCFPQIRESIVMPNMDDIPFFESSGYHHRGGIWPDAARRQYNPEKDDPSTTPNPAVDMSTPLEASDKSSASAPPSVMGLATDASRPRSSTELPAVSESTPNLPLSPKSKPSMTVDEPNTANPEGLVPTSDSARSRSPSPVGIKVNSVEEQMPRKEMEKDKPKAVPLPAVVTSSKRSSWFSRTPVSLSSSSSPVDGPRGRTIDLQSGATSAKATTTGVREHSTPRSPVLLEVGEGSEMARASSSPPRINMSETNNSGPSPTVVSSGTSGHAEAPTQDTFPDDQTDVPNDPTPTGNNTTFRPPTPMLTINGTRRATVSHQTSKSASGNFYSGGSVSSSSLPQAESSTTAVSSDSELVKGPISGTPPDTSISSNVSSLNTPNDVPQVDSRDNHELTRTLSNSSSNSLSANTSVTSSTAPTSTDISISQDPTNSGANSFLSAWKSRTADKQAINNAAKEAMKKWTVGWNSLKRGVEEERERRRSTNNTGAANSTQGDTSGVDDEGSGSDAEVMSRREGGSTSDSNSLSSSPKPRPTSLSVVPSAPRTTTEVQIHSPDLFDSSKPIIEQPKPIGTQPGRAATMTIPGIHASHQGEVMSLGSAPAPIDTSNKDKDKAQDKLMDREKSLSPTGRPSSIQNVYRLFGQRTISTNSNDAPNLTGSNEILKQPKAAASSASIDTISVTPTDDEPPAEITFSPSTPRSSTPAPLFPSRSVPNGLPTPKSPPAALPPSKDSATMSAASEALKKLAADDAARTSRPHSPHVANTASAENEDTSGASTPSDPHRATSPLPFPPRAPVTAS